VPLRRAAEYREEAVQCRSMAARERIESVKETLLKLAHQFDALAEQREQFLRQLLLQLLLATNRSAVLNAKRPKMVVRSVSSHH